MTPREADVMYVLEDVPGVVAVYALRSGGTLGADFAVEVARVRFVPAVHYALLRIFSHEECGRVFCRPPQISVSSLHRMAGAERLTLGSADREAARRRVGELAPQASAEPRRRSERSPASHAQFSALLVDLDEDVFQAIRAVFRGDSRHLLQADATAAAEAALARSFHGILCSAAAALAREGFLARLARLDPEEAARVVVLAPARDVPYVRWNLGRWGWKNTVLHTPVDETILRHELFREHPELVAHAALTDTERLEQPSIRKRRFRKLQVLVVDEDVTSSMLLSAAPGRPDAEVVHVATTMDAFEHVVSREVDLVLCSASLRADGGEPFYRLLWRLNPELKGRCVLVTNADAVPLSVPRSRPARFVERPLRRDRIAQVIEDFSAR